MNSSRVKKKTGNAYCKLSIYTQYLSEEIKEVKRQPGFITKNIESHEFSLSTFQHSLILIMNILSG